jgi:hypothetical protein
MLDLEHDANISLREPEVQTLTIGQREQFVIIQPTSITQSQNYPVLIHTYSSS